ncbi:hypothetical protein ACWEWI_25390 [Streptomyces sp. NPDC003753]
MIDLQVRAENGAVVAKGTCGYEWDSRIERSEFPLLGHVCPFTDTMFNGWQIRSLLDELARVPADWDHGWVAEVRRLGELALDSPHHYLWFVGD